jgi:hypothetical protein
MQCALKQQARSLPLLLTRGGGRVPLRTPTRCYHDIPISPFPFPLPGLSLDISRVKYTTLKEIEEGFRRVSISEPTRNVAIVEPLEPIKITPGTQLFLIF